LDLPVPHIHVACAIIERDGFVMVAQRSTTMSLPLKWEFPGGKIDAGETPQDCLKRELIEEMGLHINIGRPLSPATHSYQDFTVTLYPYVCSIDFGELVLHEHAAIVWSLPEKLMLFDWAEADGPVIHEYLEQLSIC